MERSARVELALLVWKTRALPLGQPRPDVRHRHARRTCLIARIVKQSGDLVSGYGMAVYSRLSGHPRPCTGGKAVVSYRIDRARNGIATRLTLSVRDKSYWATAFSRAETYTRNSYECN